MRIAFVWQGFSGRYGAWKDGLWAAMKEIEKRGYDVEYYDTDQVEDICMNPPDVVLYWEAPCTFAGKDGENYRAVQALPYKKALLFAGGQVQKQWCEGFDLFFVESKLNEEEFNALGLPWKRAFGVNTQIFKPEKQPKVFDGAFQATCASWKRHWLMADALHEKSVVCGRYQESDPIGFLRCREAGAMVLPELSGEAVNSLINSAHAVVNCSEFWGGGQRTTLEAMAAGIPVIVMEDAPKNREFVEESNAGLVVPPDSNRIKAAVEEIKLWTPAEKERGIAYVHSKWTEKHYAEAILEGLRDLIMKV